MDKKHHGRRLAGAVRKLPSGRYQARFRAPDGTLRPAPETFRTKAEADAWLASVATDMARDTWVDPDAGKVSFGDYAATWMSSKTDLAPKTVELYRAHEIRAATPSQVFALADHITSRYRALVLTAAYAGCRWGELAALRLCNLDFDRATLKVVEQTVELLSGTRITCAPKTAAGRRVVHLPAGLIEVLREHVDRYAAAGPDSLVFASSLGLPVRQGNFRRRHWLPAVQAAGPRGRSLPPSSPYRWHVGDRLGCHDSRGPSAIGPRVASGRLSLSARPGESRRRNRPPARRLHASRPRFQTTHCRWVGT